VAIPIREPPTAVTKNTAGKYGVKNTSGRIWASAHRAAAAATAGAAEPVTAASPATGVFEGQQAAELMAADRAHWWFRGKAALVATALRRNGEHEGFLADVGAGAGGVTAMVGWDPESVAVLEAGSSLVHHARHANGMPAVQATVAPVPLATASVDVVCLLDVIEHLADPGPALDEAARVLRGGGRLVVNVPAHQWLWSSADVHLGHHRRYDRRMLVEQLRAAGFEPVLLSHVFSWLVPPVWVERRLRRADEDAPPLGLDRSSFLIDRTAMVLTTIERLLLGRVALPFGTSLLCVATRPTSPRGTPPRR
jgi:SAM-dependent methyltransferase